MYIKMTSTVVRPNTSIPFPNGDMLGVPAEQQTKNHPLHLDSYYEVSSDGLTQTTVRLFKEGYDFRADNLDIRKAASELFANYYQSNGMIVTTVQEIIS